MNPYVKTGAQRVLEGAADSLLKGRRLGLLCNQSSVLPDLSHLRIRLQERFGARLAAIFSPQHGLFAEKQDNMKESPHEVDPATGLPVFSLYGEVRKPTLEQLNEIDILIVDLQDVGCRVYTYIWTLLLCMEACSDAGKGLVVLDRPNPLGGSSVEGPLLDQGLESFVGLIPIALSHGMTMGELAMMFRTSKGIDIDLHVVEMEGWHRGMLFPQTGLPWVWPSPNMPTFDTALVYPGQVILETINVSEGRGTTRPFEVFGAPFMEPAEIAAAMPEAVLEGAWLREQFFEPTFNKYAGQRCKGFQLHVVDPAVFRPVRFTLNLLAVLWRLYPQELRWLDPPYEYEFEKLPADLVIGRRRLREAVETGAGHEKIEEVIAQDEEAFKAARTQFLYYH